MSDSQQKQRPVLIAGAMEMETEHLITAVGAGDPVRIGPYRFYEGTLDGYPVVAVSQWVGHVNAAACAAIAITKYDPLCILVQGTAGAHTPDKKNGDIVLGENVAGLGMYFAPHREAGAGTDPAGWRRPGSFMIIDGKNTTVPVLHSDPELLEIALSVGASRGNVTKGTVASGDFWNREIDLIRALHRQYGTDCEEMESFAVHQIGASFGVPVLSIRVISNSELTPGSEFDSSTARTCQEFSLEVAKEIIRRKG